MRVLLILVMVFYAIYVVGIMQDIIKSASIMQKKGGLYAAVAVVSVAYFAACAYIFWLVR